MACSCTQYFLHHARELHFRQAHTPWEGLKKETFEGQVASVEDEFLFGPAFDDESIVLSRLHPGLGEVASFICEQSFKILDDPLCRLAVPFGRNRAFSPLACHQPC